MKTSIPDWETFRRQDEDYRLASEWILNEFRASADTSPLDENGEDGLVVLASIKAATSRDLFCVLQAKGKKYSIYPHIINSIQLIDENQNPVGESKKVVVPIHPSFIRTLPTRQQKIAIIKGAYSAQEASLLDDLERSNHPEIQGPCRAELHNIRKRYKLLSDKWLQHS